MNNIFSASEVDQEAVGKVQPLLDKYKNLGVISGFYKNKPVNFLVAMNKGEDKYDIYPLAIIVTETMLPDCGDSDNTKITNIKVQ